MRSDRRQKELQTVPSLTGLDVVMAHAERSSASDWRLVTRENLDAFAQ